MRHTSYLLLFILIAVIFACDSGIAPDAMEASVPDSNATTETLSEAREAVDPATNRRIIKQANLRFQVKDLSASTNQIESLLDAHQAYLSNSTSNSSDHRLESELTIRVVPAQFDKLISAILTESTFLDNKTITANDVTLEYVDIAARIKSNQAVEQRYLELLKQAEKIPDMLAIENELKKNREELELMQARQQALQQLTAYSTIHLSIYQILPPSFSDRTNFLTEAFIALEGGWQFLRSIVIGILYLWPLWIFLPLLIIGYRRIKNSMFFRGN